MALKNVWSLNVDEALVANEIKKHIKSKESELFFPYNAQMKDIDLVLINLKNQHVFTFQVKGSRSYPPSPKEQTLYGEGNAGWIVINKRQIFQASNKIDFFVILIHSMTKVKERLGLKLHYIVIPTTKFQELVSRKQANRKDDYNFFIWINSAGNEAFDFHEKGRTQISLTPYLDNWTPVKSAIE